MTGIRELVAEAIAAVQFQSATGYSWFGRMSPRLPARVLKSLTARTAREYLVHTLANQLYADFYIVGGAEPAQWDIPGPTGRRSDFEAALSAANCGHGYDDAGWRVVADHGTHVTVGQAGFELTTYRPELYVRSTAKEDVARAFTVAVGPDPLPAGMDVFVRMPKEMKSIAPGFYTACGDVPPRTETHGPLVRFYWHLRPTGAVPFMAAATSILNRDRVPFRLKVLNDPGAYRRCDAGVVYLENSCNWEDLMGDLHSGVVGGLLSATPVFTKPLAPGLGMAHDTGSIDSFGEHRCRMLADALVQGQETSVSDAAGLMELVERRFARDGVDLDHPHLQRGAGTTPGGAR